MRIMVVDDDPFVRAVTETALGQLHGVTVRGFAGGAAALAAAPIFRPDVVVLDLAMADLDGPATWRGLKDTVPSAMRVIVLTADEGALSRDEVKAMNPAGFIAKPFAPAVMATTVAQLIGLDAAPRGTGDARAKVAHAFCASLPATAQAMTDALVDFRSGAQGARETLLAQAHRLAGSASLFGYVPLGRLADRVEGDLRGLARGEAVDMEGLEAACAALARACAEAARGEVVPDE